MTYTGLALCKIAIIYESAMKGARDQELLVQNLATLACIVTAYGSIESRQPIPLVIADFRHKRLKPITLWQGSTKWHNARATSFNSMETYSCCNQNTTRSCNGENIPQRHTPCCAICSRLEEDEEEWSFAPKCGNDWQNAEQRFL